MRPFLALALVTNQGFFMRPINILRNAHKISQNSHHKCFVAVG